jgi:hypothetical protein
MNLYGTYVNHTHLIESRTPFCEKEPPSAEAAYGPAFPSFRLKCLHFQLKGARMFTEALSTNFFVKPVKSVEVVS